MVPRFLYAPIEEVSYNVFAKLEVEESLGVQDK